MRMDPSIEILTFKTNVYLVGVISSGHGVVRVIICQTVRGTGYVHGGRTVPTDNSRNMGWPRNALVLKQLDA